MTEIPIPKADPDLIPLLDKEEPTDLERLLSGHELHRCGLELLAQGYSSQAEACFRMARHASLVEKQYDLWRLVSIDLARSLNERSPRLALLALSQLEPCSISANLICTFYNVLGQALASVCHYTQADAYYLKALDCASVHKSHVQLACILGNRATLSFEYGAHSEAKRLNQEAVSMLADSNSVGIMGLLLMNMATNAMHEGFYDEAGTLFDKVHELSTQASNVRLNAYASINRGELALITGEVDSACDLFRLGETQANLASLPGLQVQGLILRSIIERQLSLVELLEAAEAAANDLRSRELIQESAPIALIAASLAASRGHPADRYLSILDSGFAAIDQPRVLISHYQKMLSVLIEKHREPITQTFPKFITESSAVLKVKERLIRLVNSEVRILIEGETGTGKSFLARQIHEARRNRNAPFIVVDCTNLEENLFESKLFGHLRGSFTGAIADTVGLVEQANGGTLFLDEIGELPTEIQGKLLYTIEEQRYRPVGAKAERHAEFRVVAATNRDIDGMLANGTLRGDLFFRLAGYRVQLPPLRDRREDIIPLADYRLEQLNVKYGRRKTLRSDAWEELIRYSWPGNVRELNAALERGYHLSCGRRVRFEDLGLGLSPDSLDLTDLSWYQVRRQHLLRVLRLCRGNVTRAAQLLGLNRTTLIYKLKLLDIGRKDFDLSWEASGGVNEDDPSKDGHSSRDTDLHEKRA